MQFNLKNIARITMYLGLFLPFILITDFFPFLRFGMFAEPVQNSIQTEQFQLILQNKDNTSNEFDPHRLGSNENSFLYLCRNYYYRNELHLFAKKLFETPPLKNTNTIQIFRYTQENATPILIGEFKREE